MHSLAKLLNADTQQDLLWDYTAIDHLIPATVHEVTDRFNNTGFFDLLGPLRAAIKEDGSTGIQYAFLKKKSDSATTLVVHFNPFGNGLDDNMLIRAAYLQQVFEGFSISDSRGLSVPLITFAAPNAQRAMRLKKHHHQKTARGEFDALAHEYATILAGLGYTSLLIIGFSQGATIAAAVAAVASDYGMTVTHLAAGEPANVMKRSSARLMRDFNSEVSHLDPAIQASGIQHLRASGIGANPVPYVLGLVRTGRVNMTMVSGLSKETFALDLQKVLKQDCVITLGWGGLNTIAPPAVMKGIVEKSRTSSNAHYHAIHTVELKGAHHSWADQLNVLATFYAYALIR